MPMNLFAVPYLRLWTGHLDTLERHLNDQTDDQTDDKSDDLCDGRTVGRMQDREHP